MTRLPGDRAVNAAAMLRVDQAGEYGAMRIYAGQLAVLGNRHPAAREIARMQEGEARHLATFDRMIADRQVRPTLLQPFWHVAGFALGAATALMGPKAAMACTVAVESEIDRHYGEQLATLVEADPELSGHIADFRADELEHKATALAHGAEEAPAYPILSAVIGAACRLAIASSKRI
jgi:3-demethoxyubiquinol 3-hydroxylase